MKQSQKEHVSRCNLARNSFSFLLYINYLSGIASVFVQLAFLYLIFIRIFFESKHLGPSLFEYWQHMLILLTIGITNIIFPLRGKKIGIVNLILSILTITICYIFIPDPRW